MTPPTEHQVHIQLSADGWALIYTPAGRTEIEFDLDACEFEFGPDLPEDPSELSFEDMLHELREGGGIRLIGDSLPPHLQELWLSYAESYATDQAIRLVFDRA